MTATQIAAALRQRILSGEFAFGSRMPNVRELAQEYDSSQQTAAAAYAALAGMGMVRTHRGKQGTVVAAGPPASAHLGTFGPYDVTAATAWKPSAGQSGDAVTARVRQMPATAAMATWGIEEGSEVVERTRLRSVDGIPVQHKITVMPYDLAARRPAGYEGVPPMLAPVGAARVDPPAGVRMADWLGWGTVRTESSITAEPMDKEAALALGLPEDVPGFRVVGISVDASNATTFVTVTTAPLHHRITLDIIEEPA
jgi:GntR family transcriptional regulator